MDRADNITARHGRIRTFRARFWPLSQPHHSSAPIASCGLATLQAQRRERKSVRIYRGISAAILGLSVAAGLTTAGYFVSQTMYKGRLASNAVTVRGFAEQDVRADLALWQIGFSVTGSK